MTAPTLLIVGYGNPLMGDDGAAIAIIERLGELGPPATVRVEVGHTDALTLRSAWRGENQVWLVDALWSNESPGTLIEVGHDALLEIPQAHVSAHQLSLPESLRWLRLTYPEMAQVRFRLWGIVAAQVGLGQGLSAPVAASVDPAARKILDALCP